MARPNRHISRRRTQGANSSDLGVKAREDKRTDSATTQSTARVKGASRAKPRGPRIPRLLKHEQDSLHLAEFSQGKPYELSLNVLENKALEQNPTASGTPAVLSGTVAASGAIANAPSRKAVPLMDESSQAEVSRRQKKRRFTRAISALAIVAVSCAVIAAGGVYLWQQNEDRLSNVDLLHRAASHIEAADQVIVDVDSFFQQAFDENTPTRITELQLQLPTARTELQRASTYAERANQGLTSAGTDKTAAENTLSTIASRETLLQIAEDRLAEDAAAYQAVTLAHDAWDQVESANSLIAQAAIVVSNTSPETTNRSTEYLTSARDLLAQASSALTQAQEAYPAADLALVTQYVAERALAVDEALASNDAILLQDRQTAETHNEAYNQADARAVDLAESLPEDIAQPIYDAYEKEAGELGQEYESVRADVARSDAFLRGYLN